MANRSLPDMARITARVPRGEAGYWDIMRRLDAERGEFTVADVEAESNVGAGGVAQYLRKLVKAGIARQVGKRPAPARPAKVYQLVKRPKVAPRLRVDGSAIGRSDFECLWCAMRTLRQFTIRDVAFAATTARPINLTTAGNYVERLFQAGYLARLDRGVYRLNPASNTGPLAPAILRVSVVWDRNLKRVMGGEHAAQEVTR